jgi:curved DNA-binding protein CbpA
MEQILNTFDFYRLLGVQPEAAEAEIIKAYDALIASLEPDKKPPEEKKEAALTVIAADAAREVLANAEQRKSFDAKLEEYKRAESEKDKIEARRAGKLQEQQSIEDDEKLKQVSLHLDAASEALADFYYEQLFAAAQKRSFETIPLEKLLEWLSLERAELLRRAEQKGRRIAFRIDWHGFEEVQEMRKKRGEEIGTIIDTLVQKLEKE